MHKPSTCLIARPLRAVSHSAAAAASMALMSASAAIVYVDNLDTTLTSSASKGATQGPLVSMAISINGTPVFTANLRSDSDNVSPSTISIVNRQNGFAAYGSFNKGGNPVTIFSGREHHPSCYDDPCHRLRDQPHRIPHHSRHR